LLLIGILPPAKEFRRSGSAAASGQVFRQEIAVGPFLFDIDLPGYRRFRGGPRVLLLRRDKEDEFLPDAEPAGPDIVQVSEFGQGNGVLLCDAGKGLALSDDVDPLHLLRGDDQDLLSFEGIAAEFVGRLEGLGADAQTF